MYPGIIELMVCAGIDYDTIVSILYNYHRYAGSKAGYMLDMEGVNAVGLQIPHQSISEIIIANTTSH